MLLLDYWLHSGAIVRLAVCFIFSIKSQRPWKLTKGNAEMRNMSKKTWKLRVWNHMTEMQKLDILLKHAKVPHYELQKDTLIKPNATLRDVVELCMNGDISYADAREWCMENDISLGQFDRWLYGALRKSDNPARVKPKEPWPYRVVAGINRVLEILLNSILEDFI